MPKATEYTLIFDQVKQNQNDCKRAQTSVATIMGYSLHKQLETVSI